MYTNSSGKATSENVQKNIWRSAFFPEKMWSSCLAEELRLLCSEKRTGFSGKVRDAKAITASAAQFSLCHGIFLLQKVQIGAFGYQNMPPVCSLGTNISTVNIILWDLHLDYRPDWLRFLLWLIFELVIIRLCYGQKEGV